MFVALTLIIFATIAFVGYYIWKTFAKQIDIMRLEYEKISSEKSELAGKISILEGQLHDKDASQRDLLDRYQTLYAEKVAIETMRNEAIRYRDQLKLELTQLSQEVIEAKKQKFSEEAKREVGTMISDLQQEFATFKNDIFSPETKSRNELSGHLQSLLLHIDKMQTEAERLTHALRHDSKAQGDWGEIQLENLLEQAGLSEDNGDYIKQGKGLELLMESGPAKPDFLIRLPREQWILVDAKVSLSAYERMIHAESKEEQEQQMSLHIRSMMKHIDEVAKYHAIRTSIAICPFLLMFIPIESAYASAISCDKKDIASYARQKDVIIVYPSTLFLTLRLIQAIWQVEKQDANAKEIAERGGKLYDKFCGLLDELREVYKLFQRTHEQFGEKVIPKINGRGGLLSQCEDLQKLGAKNKKTIKILTES